MTIQASRWRVGVDVGGTFTDICLEEGAGTVAFWKVPSTPSDPSVGMLLGLREALGAIGIEEAAVRYLAHGTTVATNMLLERRGARTAVLATAGFRDQLEIARGQWPTMYDLHAAKPELLVERDLCFDVPERMLFDGTVHTALDEPCVRDLALALASESVESAAVCFLHAYANPLHEQRVREIFRDVAPEIAVSLSSDVLSEQREYERLVTTAANAYLVPAMALYLYELADRVRDSGFRVEPLINASSGGLIPIATAAAKPVLTILSGPSAGAVGALDVAVRSGLSNLITFDMGGTSADVALIDGGELPVVMEKRISGLPLSVPTADVVTIGAGGGSIARVDEGGLLKVGPESAGASPGPACYAAGGEKPTVTDAMLVLGYLGERSLLGGRMRIDARAAARAIEDHVARPLGVAVDDAALGVLAVARSNIEQAIRLVSVDRGFDPRDFTLVAYGGAGPQHAAAIATSLSLGRVLVPPSPGTLCARGLLATDLRTDYSKSVHVALDDNASDRLATVFAALQTDAQDWFSQNDVAAEQQELRRSVDLRYVGQHHQVTIPLPSSAGGELAWDGLWRAFAEKHRRLYGHAADGSLEIVAVRLTALARVERGSSGASDRPSQAGTQDVATRLVRFDGFDGRIETPVYDREVLATDEPVAGPCIVEQMDTTTVILPGQEARVDDYGNLVIELVAASERVAA
jgi:N-methylhydantoinase A